jgi:phytoene dehydrogenase-like protein
MNDVIIIGAGIAGLTAANYLEEQGFSPLVIESTSRVGGRVKTDVRDGYRMDRGFQVFLPAYPEAKKLLDYEALDLKYFSPGAKILMEDGGIETISDPLQEWKTVFTTAFSRVGSLKDKLKVYELKKAVEKKTVAKIFGQQPKSTRKFLREFGFSEEMIELFFQPFFAGIFLEKALNTSSNMFEFVFKMFAEQNAAVPARGMSEIPVQLKSKLHQTTFHFDERVTHIEGNTVFTNKHQEYKANAILIATEATGLIKQYKPEVNTNFQGTTCLYFSADTLHEFKKYVILNSSKSRIINNIAVMSNVSSDYAPKGKHLIACCTVGLSTDGNEDLIFEVKEELKPWFGESVAQWHHLKTYHIPFALSQQLNVELELNPKALQIREGLYCCGDHLLNSSLNAAMKTGRIAAELIGKKLK